MKVGGQRHAPAALPPEKRPGTHCIGGWLSPMAFQPVASRYTDWALPAHNNKNNTNKEATFIDIAYSSTHNLQTTNTEKQRKYQFWRLKSSNSGNWTRLLLFHWSCLLRWTSLTCLTFWGRNYFFFNFSTPVYKMWIIQEPNTLELWNKLHFEEEKTEIIYHV